MRWNNHSDLEGKHSFLSPSQHSWTNYTEDQLRKNFKSAQAKQKGTELHDLISRMIKFNYQYGNIGEKDEDLLLLQKTKKTPNMFFRDAMEDRMDSEVPLYYSEFAFGTADAIGFEDNVLRIYDLKTGTIAADMKQLKIYAALFCLEYNISPFDIVIFLRIYQNKEIVACEPTPDEICKLMDKIIYFDDVLQSMKAGGRRWKW